MSALIVVGTDTGVGKTVFSAGLTAALNAGYWKPVQSGLEDATDTETVRLLSGAEVLPEAYRLNLPASPHLSAEDMGVEIDLSRLAVPQVDGPLVVEGAGGLMVPLNRQSYYLDLIAQWQAPVVLVARTALGTINHTTLSLMALRGAGCEVVGVAFVGEAEPDVEQTIVEMSNVRHLGRLPVLSELTQQTLKDAFSEIDVVTIRRFL
ncbi:MULTISPECIES: dethiobiotin synthase [unclassified Ruegeria]|uniref:dethiobiotin synthase n=1 Tax=unclassified Ruegeria TaxID=2625375 RepID=UPI001487CB32|nr:MULTISPECIES: dethiobiotin synthase [unclassified Ruegeria]NOD34372.1 ATP-dependent dethiobiotin synthetase BioD [Ruegeria sp. HKCCD7296]NOD47492.1 ATP-dependent dethiobiotin synthetase BioD [Ruegeria sp. HKCCD5849]NOD53115.1 ATP-dependent dethiobiotin synthetase BioD [Ruegeria sp. HKCCD5851]NOD66308.1 ATP-dependent dethiobiotin synthetase BioD [Ruegeria sp. HKCCD7303]NOE40405.1 ATP-dependent dethiobiotin synthetase BioD [Ruegeria sp. HKCCD7319]